jgi:hypothetical protein
MRRVATLFVLALLALVVLPAAALAAAAPTIGYSAPDPIRNREATLRFAIDPEGLETSYEVEIAKVGSSLHSWGMPGVVEAGEEPVARKVKVPRYFEGGLQPGTEYHWRITAWNTEGETVGSEQFFITTEGSKAQFTDGTATQTGLGTVALSGTVDPEGSSLTGCRFRWVDKETFLMAGFEKWAAAETVRFGETTPCQESFAEIGSGSGPVAIHGEATGLEPGEYVFRVEGENAYEDSVATSGVPFTVSSEFGKEKPAPQGPPAGIPGPPAETPPVRKPCPQTHRGKAHGKKHQGKKRGHAKKHPRGKACGRS